MTEQANTLPFLAYVQTAKKETSKKEIVVGDIIHLAYNDIAPRKLKIISVSAPNESERVYVAHDTKSAITAILKLYKDYSYDTDVRVMGKDFIHTSNSPVINFILANNSMPTFNVDGKLCYEGERNVPVYTPIKVGDVFVHRDRSSDHVVEHVCADGSLVVSRVADKKGGIREHRSIMIRRTDTTMLAALSPSLVWKSGKVSE